MPYFLCLPHHHHPPPLHPTPSPPPPPNGLSVIGGLWKVKTLSSIFPGRCGKVNYGLFSCITFLTAEKKGEKFMFQITICKSKTFVGQRNCMSFYEQTNERTNERTNEWIRDLCTKNPVQSNEISSVILSWTIWFSLFYKIKVNISFSSNVFFVTLGKGSYGEQRLPTRYTSCIP